MSNDQWKNNQFKNNQWKNNQFKNNQSKNDQFKKPQKKCYAYCLPQENRSGTTETWAECEEIVRGKDALFKSFTNPQDAYVWLKNPTYKKSLFSDGIHSGGTHSGGIHSGPIKQVFNPNAPLKHTMMDIPSELLDVPKDYIKVWTDGACPYNQSQKRAYAGIGVYFGPDDPRNLSEPLTGTKQTNQRAELMAIIRAMEQCPNANMYIYSDSTYSIKGATEWMKNWKRNGWKKQNGDEILNMDLWEKMDAQMQSRKILFRWVKGHSEDEGNIQADKLAVAGAEQNLQLRTNQSNQNQFDPSNRTTKNQITNNQITKKQKMNDDEMNDEMNENMFGDSSD